MGSLFNPMIASVAKCYHGIRVGPTALELVTTGFLWPWVSESVNISHFILGTDNIYIVQYTIFLWTILPEIRWVPCHVNCTWLVGQQWWCKRTCADFCVAVWHGGCLQWMWKEYLLLNVPYTLQSTKTMVGFFPFQLFALCLLSMG